MGQINEDSKFGKILTELASDDNNKIILEVGTWDGQGTTKCLVKGVLNQRNPLNAHIYSIEANKDFFNKAVKHWNNGPKFLHLINGTLHSDILSPHEITTHPLFHKVKAHYNLWYDDEKNSVKNSPTVRIQTPVDFAILDGGEFSTEGDWNVVKKQNPKIVALDDTSVIKCYNIRKELMNSPYWKVLYDEPNDRNGWAVFERIK
jgi:hypothetical protein